MDFCFAAKSVLYNFLHKIQKKNITRKLTEYICLYVSALKINDWIFQKYCKERCIFYIRPGAMSFRFKFQIILFDFCRLSSFLSFWLKELKEIEDFLLNDSPRAMKHMRVKKKIKTSNFTWIHKRRSAHRISTIFSFEAIATCWQIQTK